VTRDSHPTEQAPGRPLKAPQNHEPPVAGTERRPGGEFGAQASAEGFDGPEIHHWDAAKTAEVARLLAKHPPRVQWTTTNAHPQEQAVECPPGVHSLFDPCPGDCSKPLTEPEEQQ
jgi:hypothetical protein